MGVLACSRLECESVMCDTHIDGVGYICNECMSEFKIYLEENGRSFLVLREMLKELKIFIETEKNEFNLGDTMDANEFFDTYGT